MNAQERVALLERLLERIRTRRSEPRTRVVVAGAEAGSVVPSDIAAEAMRDAGLAAHETVELEELDVMEEMAPDSRTESVVDLPPTDEEAPISERRPKSELPVADVTIEDIEREAEVEIVAEEALLVEEVRQVPTIEQMGSTVDLPQGDESVGPLELAQPVDLDEGMEADFGAHSDDADLEASLPRGAFAGGWDESLAAPDGAADDLERLDADTRAREADFVRAIPQRAPSVPPPPNVAAAGFESIARQPVDAASPVAVLVGARPGGSRSFLALLDDSLGLG